MGGRGDPSLRVGVRMGAILFSLCARRLRILLPIRFLALLLVSRQLQQREYRPERHQRLAPDEYIRPAINAIR